jgi:hypothetical protein
MMSSLSCDVENDAGDDEQPCNKTGANEGDKDELSSEASSYDEHLRKKEKKKVLAYGDDDNDKEDLYG